MRKNFEDFFSGVFESGVCSSHAFWALNLSGISELDRICSSSFSKLLSEWDAKIYQVHKFNFKIYFFLIMQKRGETCQIFTKSLC